MNASTSLGCPWAAATIKGWYGPDRKSFQNYAEAFHSAWSDGKDAAAQLVAVASDRTPGFARAGALTELATRVSRQNVELVQAALKDPDPMVRIGALDMLENLPAAQQRIGQQSGRAPSQTPR